MENSAKVFQTGFDKAASTVPLSNNMIKDINMYKGSMKEEGQELEGGLADKLSLGDIAVKHKVDIEDLTKQFLKGIKTEMEHTNNKTKAAEIAMDHLTEDPKYYTKLKKVEKKVGKEENKERTGSGSSGAFSGPIAFKDSEFLRNSFKETPKLKEEIEKVEANEATGSGSVGAFETPAAWAKSTKKKDWRGKSKTQIPGGAFVSVKEKCKKFPYCNQGDIKALHIYKNESVKEAIENVSKKLNISQTTVKAILEYEMEKLKKHLK